MTPQEQQASDVMHRELGVKYAPQVDPDPRWYPIGNHLFGRFKDGSMWIRHDQRYGDTEIRSRDFLAIVRLAEKHGWQCD